MNSAASVKVEIRALKRINEVPFRERANKPAVGTGNRYLKIENLYQDCYVSGYEDYIKT